MSLRGFILTFALSGCATYTGSGVPGDFFEARSDPGWSLVTRLPELRQQGDWDCGLAAIDNVIDFWQVTVDPRLVQRVLGDVVDPPRPATAGELRDVVRAHGLAAFVIAGEIADLVEQVGKGRPMIVGLLKPTLGGANAHYEIVVGIHAQRRLVLSYDPGLGYRQNDIAAFEREWRATGSVLLVVVPRPRAAVAAVPSVRRALVEDAVRPPTFVEDVWQALRSQCAGCHHAAAGSGTSGLVFTNDARADYESTLRYVDLDAPLQSPLLRKARGETTHSGGRVLEIGGPLDRELIRWIAGGVRFRRPTYRPPDPIDAPTVGRASERAADPSGARVTDAPSAAGRLDR